MRLVIILLLFTYSSISSAIGMAKLKPYTGSEQTPALVLYDLQGNKHNLNEYIGKVVLIQFWATYCAPCRTEMPSMNRLQKKLNAQKFVILAVNMAEERSEIDAFLKEVKTDFTILYDPDGRAITAWKVFAAPANFVIGKDGKIKYTLYGGVEWDSEEITKAVKSLM